MESGEVAVDHLNGCLDLQSTVESGQSYLWDRADGRAYETTGSHGGSAWYHTVIDREFIRARQRDGVLEWESTTDAWPYLKSLLRLDDDLASIMAATPDHQLIETAYRAYPGMRIVQDPFFGCLISFICSPQMRVERIFTMIQTLCREYGPSISVNGETYHGFPAPAQLAVATEAELRSLGLGYRAPYVCRTAEMVDSGELTQTNLPTTYEATRRALTGFMGVGDKVADCVCLFSLGYLEAVPLDTWIRTAIANHFPDCDRGSYGPTSRAIRKQFGPYAGYAQTYVFHHLRHIQ